MDRVVVKGALPLTTTRLDNTVTNNKKIIDVLFKTDPPTTVKTKAILCGHYVDIYKYEIPLIINRKPSRRLEKDKSDRPYLFEVYIARRGEYRKRTKNRVIGAVQRLVESNFDKDSIFLTLTFNNENKFDITDLKICNSKLHNFMAKLKENFNDLKYLIVPEFQKRGAVHYHMIINRPFIDKTLVQKLWKYGFIKLRDIYYIEGIGNYFTKYLTKNCDDERLYGKRSFFTSKNLRRPKIKYGEFPEKLIKRLEEKGIKPYFKDSYQSEFNGIIEYNRYYIEGKI